MYVRGIQRNVKNVVRNYNEAQVKVREATSNDPWGASSTLMGEIADLTFKNVAFAEIMQMIWKRINDHGKNWRHVYKALVLLEYLIKTGSEKVAQQCRENIFTIYTLKDFQYVVDGKDCGLSVREKSKALVNLLKDDEKLKIERERALKARERFAQSSSVANSISSDGLMRNSVSYHETFGAGGSSTSPLGRKNSMPLQRTVSSEVEIARPHTICEEELHLQLALAMSKEEAEQEERLKKNDDLRLQLALNASEKELKQKKPVKNSAIDDLLDLDIGTTAASTSMSTLFVNNSTAATLRTTDPWGMPVEKTAVEDFSGLGATASNDLWSLQSIGNGSTANSTSTKLDPWSTTEITLSASPANNDPWLVTPPTVTPVNNDPWTPSPTLGATANSVSQSFNHSDPWQPVGGEGGAVGGIASEPWMISGGGSASAMSFDGGNVFNSSPLNHRLSPSTSSPSAATTRKTPENFLGVNSSLVNLDALISKSSTSVPATNPFMVTPSPNNPFLTPKSTLTMNQLRTDNNTFIPK